MNKTFSLEKPLVPIYITERYILVMVWIPPKNISVEMIIQATCLLSLSCLVMSCILTQREHWKKCNWCSLRNDACFWRPIGYIANLGYGAPTKEKTKLLHTKTPAIFKLQNEHNCIAAALAPCIKILKLGGIRVTIKSKPVIAKVWIHFFMGDTSGHNRWLGHFNSDAKIQWPYCDCKCRMDDMNNLNPTCIYLTREDYHQHIAQQSTSEEKTNLDSSDQKCIHEWQHTTVGFEMWCLWYDSSWKIAHLMWRLYKVYIQITPWHHYKV